MKNWIRKKWEIMWLWLAYYVLIERNVSRSAVISRRDNNDLWYLGEKVQGVIDRINDEYKNVTDY